MPYRSRPIPARCVQWALAAVLCLATFATQAQSRNLAPGFSSLPPDAKVTVAPLDVELFELTAGGILAPKADWTEAANRHMGAALKRKTAALGLESLPFPDAVAEAHAELLHLYGAVARAISLHHMGALQLPTKEGRLEWSFGDSLRPLQQATGARYALFTWVRDSYATAERKAMMVGLALLGVGITAGVQMGYASLVDLESGQVMWFNQLVSVTGDLRDEPSAVSSVDGLLVGFPGTPAARAAK